MSGRLWVVATPIGNLDDVTLRALSVLREADAILAEDTRRTKRLCSHHGIDTPLRSFHAHTKDDRVEALVAELAGGSRLALVTDAGMPLVSDPGIRLVAGATGAGVRVESVPGPSAVTAALTVAAIRCDAFRFVGFLPRGGGRRRRLLDEIAAERGATVLFEAPKRLAGTLQDLGNAIGAGRTVAVCRELTKVHEEVARGPAEELAERFAEGTRGEVTLVVEGTGAEPGATAAAAPGEEELRERVLSLLEGGEGPSAVAQRVAGWTGKPRGEAYRLVLRIREGLA